MDGGGLVLTRERQSAALVPVRVRPVRPELASGGGVLGGVAWLSDGRGNGRAARGVVEPLRRELLVAMTQFGRQVEPDGAERGVTLVVQEGAACDDGSEEAPGAPREAAEASTSVNAALPAVAECRCRTGIATDEDFPFYLTSAGEAFAEGGPPIAEGWAGARERLASLLPLRVAHAFSLERPPLPPRPVHHPVPALFHILFKVFHPA